MSQLSMLANSLVGSEIVRLGNAINARIAQGEKIYNYTIGDFNPKIFPIPAALEDEIIIAYKNKATNYPSADGILPLRKAVIAFLKDYNQVQYSQEEIQIASGGRPLIYALFKTIVDPGDHVIYAVPSWNNNHYTAMNYGKAIEIQASPENNFMLTAADLAPHLSKANLLCLCTPQNPTGTTFSKHELEKICQLVVSENEKRGEEEKKLYVMFDQMYHTLTFGDTEHNHPVALLPAMKNYTITIDGISKSFAATGVRVGWAAGPADVIAKMKAFLSHIGAWAPMAEQVAVGKYLGNKEEVHSYLNKFKKQIELRLRGIYEGFKSLKTKGFKVDAIAPQAAIYLTVKIDVKGMLFNGKKLENQEEVTNFLLEKAQMAIVPFYCFGADPESPWFRISVGTCTLEDIQIVLQNLENALSQLSE